MEQPSAQRGLWKLMLRLPSLRGQLRILSEQSQNLLNLCDAFDDASLMLERLQKDRTSDRAIVLEYEALCRDIESEVVELCTLLSRNGTPPASA